MEKSNSLDVSIINDVIHSFLSISKQLNFNDYYKVMSGSIRYLIHFYSNNSIKNDLLITLISSIHLASKVYERYLSLSKLIDFSQQIFFYDYSESLKNISYNLFESENWRNELIRSCRNREMELFTNLKFDFDLPAPHKVAIEYCRRIISWRKEIDNKLFEVFIKQIRNITNKLMTIPEFYFVQCNFISLMIIQLVFDSYSLIVYHSSNDYSWLNFFDININIDDFKKFHEKCKDKLNPFKERNPPEIIKELQLILDVDWRVNPIYCNTNEPLCPPPSFNILEKFIGNEDIYNYLPNTHYPLLPPPPMFSDNQNKIPLSILPLNNFKIKKNFNNDNYYRRY